MSARHDVVDGHHAPLRRWPRVSLLRLPGVHRPQADTALLAVAAAAAPIPRRARVLDVCTGSGALAMMAARLGAGEVTAVDVSRRAVMSVRLNAWARGVPVRAWRGSLADLLTRPRWVATGDEPYDVVLANPPYVPCPSGMAPTGRERAWTPDRTGGPYWTRSAPRRPACCPPRASCCWCSHKCPMWSDHLRCCGRAACGRRWWRANKCLSARSCGRGPPIWRLAGWSGTVSVTRTWW